MGDESNKYKFLLLKHTTVKSDKYKFLLLNTTVVVMSKEQNIGNYGYIGTWILWKYRKYQKISVDILTKISVMQKLTKIL